jgi:hypothetical protein
MMTAAILPPALRISQRQPLAQTGRSASAGVGYSRVDANLKRNLDDVPVVETDGAECGEKVIDVRFQFLGELGGMRTAAEILAGGVGRRSAYTNIL